MSEPLTEVTPFRLAVVPGAQPQRWVRTWHERLPDVPLELVHLAAADAADALLGGRADAALLRLPVDREHLDAIPLYTETTVVLVPTDHLLASTGDDDEVAVGDLADEVVVVPQDDVVGLPSPPADAHRPATTADAVELVAAGVGVLVVPQSLARLHHRKDLTYRTLTDVPTSSVALAWHRDRTTDLVEEMIGIVRGRTANSSRGRGATAPPAPAGEPRTQPEPRPARGRGARGAAAGGQSAPGPWPRKAPGRKGGGSSGGRGAGRRGGR